MPTLDPTRAAFASQEFRFETAEDLSVKANYPNAVELVIDTQLAAASAATLASTMLAATKTHALAFEVEIDGVLNLNDFDTTVNHYTVSFPQYATDGRTFKLVNAEMDWAANKTILRIRG